MYEGVPGLLPGARGLHRPGSERPSGTFEPNAALVIEGVMASPGRFCFYTEDTHQGIFV